MDFNILALAFRADTLLGRNFVSFTFTRISSFSTLPIASLIKSTFINFVFRSIATHLCFFRPLRSLSYDCKLYI
jgi:hypothetical protein